MQKINDKNSNTKLPYGCYFLVFFPNAYSRVKLMLLPSESGALQTNAEFKSSEITTSSRIKRLLIENEGYFLTARIPAEVIL